MYVILISFIRRGVINISSNNQFSFFSAGERTEQNISDTFKPLYSKTKFAVISSLIKWWQRQIINLFELY